jgi:hypothetical protein
MRCVILLNEKVDHSTHNQMKTEQLHFRTQIKARSKSEQRISPWDLVADGMRAKQSLSHPLPIVLRGKYADSPNIIIILLENVSNAKKAIKTWTTTRHAEHTAYKLW